MSKLIQASQWLKEKVGKSKGSADNEFDLLYTRQEQVRDKTAATIKHFQQLVENFHAFSSTLGFIVDDINNVFDEGDKYKDNVLKLGKATEELEKESVLPFQSQINGPSVVGKLQEYLVSFDQIKAMKKTRDGKLLEYDYHKEQVESLSTKTQKDPLKLPKAKELLAKAKTDYETTNDLTKQVMIGLIDAKIDYDPVYATFLGQLVEYQKTTSDIITSVYKDLKGGGGSSGNSSSFQKKQYGGSTPLPGKIPESENMDDFLHKEENLSMKPISIKKEPPRVVQSTPSFNKPQVVREEVIPPKLKIDWFYLDKDMAQLGPISVTEMKSMFKRGDLNSDAYVFGGEMSDWAKIATVSDLATFLKK
jgi:hypothetical protein